MLNGFLLVAKSDWQFAVEGAALAAIPNTADIEWLCSSFLVRCAAMLQSYSGYVLGCLLTDEIANRSYV